MTGSERVVIELPDDLLFGKNGNEDPFHARGLGCLLGKKNQKYIAIDYWNGQQMIDYLSLNNGKFVYWRGRNLGNHEIIKNPGGSPPEETAWKMLISH